MLLRRHVLIGLALGSFTACGAPEPERADVDGDGFDAESDCDDGDPFVYPGAPEHCNGHDDDCNGLIDDDATSATTLWYVDADGDGFGDPETSTRACAAPDGHIARGEDCDDGDAEVYPGRVDGCDGVDSNCDGIIDDDPSDLAYLDRDGDGFGGPVQGWGCVGVDATLEPSDCNDGSPQVFPGAEERCNGVDDDCDGLADDLDPEGPVDPSVWYADFDLDGFGDDGATVLACTEPTGNVTGIPGDCDDEDNATYPGAIEGCEPVDRNCDGLLPDDTAWWSTAYPSRIPLEVSAPVDRDQAVVSVTVDLGAAGQGIDPRTIALVVQDCSVGGAVRLDAEFTDGLGGIFDGAESLPVGDDVGGLHAVLDRPLLAGASVPLALYVGGPIASVPGEAEATGEALESGVVTLAFDRVDGGLPAVVVDALTTVVDGQLGSAPVLGTGGPAGASGPLDRGLATTTVVQAGEMVAAVDVVTPYDRVDPGDAVVEQRIRWVAVTGLPTVYGWVDVDVLEGGALSSLASVGFGAGAQRGIALADTHGGAFGSWSADDGHLAFGWVDAPSEHEGVALRGDQLFLEGADVVLPGAVTVGPLLDGGLVGVHAAAGPVSSDVVLEALDPRVDVVVGGVETP